MGSISILRNLYLTILFEMRLLCCSDRLNIALQPIAVGSRDVESAVKQMGMRVKLSGARWAQENVNQILSFLCAYLNGVFDIA